MRGPHKGSGANFISFAPPQEVGPDKYYVNQRPTKGMWDMSHARAKAHRKTRADSRGTDATGAKDRVVIPKM